MKILLLLIILITLLNGCAALETSPPGTDDLLKEAERIRRELEEQRNTENE